MVLIRYISPIHLPEIRPKTVGHVFKNVRKYPKMRSENPFRANEFAVNEVGMAHVRQTRFREIHRPKHDRTNNQQQYRKSVVIRGDE